MFANRIFDQMDRLFGPTGFTAPAPAYPPLNVWDDADNFYVESELPGMKLDDIAVSVAHGDQLTIAGQRTPQDVSRAGWLRQECSYGQFTRTITLPSPVDSDGVEARYDAGVLTLTLPKSEIAKPRRIAIKAGTPELAAA
jgi:HSP20 family protein